MSKVPQNKKFSYLQKSTGDEEMKLIFLAADKHESFLQDDSTTLGLLSQACRKYSTQDNEVSISLQFLKENLKDEVDFFYQQINIKGFFKLILSF